MFLNRLSGEQKELFLDLCIHASKSNDNFDDAEKLVIEQYCDEMRIDVRFDEQHTEAEVAERLLEISSPSDLRIVLLETASLILSDNFYDEDEKAFFEGFAAKVGVSKEELDSLVATLGELTELYARINEFVFG
ncbi:MAG: hypothetical protein IKP95_11990 [Ruminococcus sp.]|nr:hypothetical protein [Ruminococcus sp.]